MTRRALVVDDDRSMVKTLSDVLQLKGWEVTGAYSGRAAVEESERGAFDVVLMDIKMPGMDGVSAFKAIKAARPDTRVVLMTAYAAHELILEAEREGVLRVMPKPVDVASLLALLATSLELKRPVLLIDNDAAFLKTLSEVLRLKGYDAVMAQNLDDATRLLVERRPAAVLLHLHLGAASARDAVVAVHEISPAVAVILYSGRPGGEEEAERAIPTEWIHAYLQKPFAVDEVAGVLDDIRAG